VDHSDPELWAMSHPYQDTALHDHRAPLRESEELGYRGVWRGEAAAVNAFTPSALAAARAGAPRLS
jgi:hypothetical protein